MNDINFAVIYGDLRQKLLIEILAYDGFNVRTLGFKNKFNRSNILVCDDYKSAIENSDIIIGPTPFSKDGKNLFTIYDDLPILNINEVFKLCSKKIFMAGMLSDSVKDLADSYDFPIFDLLDGNEGAILNAIPTSEGAIQIAMQESDITMHGSNALILGYGRCGKILAQKLKGIDVNVYVCARKTSDTTYAKAYGYNTIKYSELKNSNKDFDFIFNTIPSMVLDKEMIEKLKQNCIIIDLASAPGGTDFKSASENNIKALFCPSLPGRVAPRTVANTMKKSILNILKEEGFNYGELK